MKQKKLMFNFFVNRNWSKLTDTRKRAKILADNRKSHHPIETLLLGNWIQQEICAVSQDHESFYFSTFHVTERVIRKNTFNKMVPTEIFYLWWKLIAL